MKYLLLFALLICSGITNAQNINRKQLLEDVEILSSDVYEGRKTGTVENKMAAKYIIDRFKNIGLTFYQDSFMHPFTFKNKEGIEQKGTNLIGYIKGRKSDVIVISAHYDHLGITNYLINNGADDNASGVSGLLATATYFKKHKPKHTLLFIAFDAEEPGLFGSYAYMKNTVLDEKRIKLNVNMDMISHNNKSELYVAGAFKTPIIKTLLAKADQETGIKLLFGHDEPRLGDKDWTMQSDQAAFAQKNIPFVYFGIEDHADYHKPTDEYQNINKDFFYGAANTILNSIIRLDRNLNKIH